MSWVLDVHNLKDMTIRAHNISHQEPHQPPLFHNLTRCLISIPRSLSQEVVCGEVLNPHRCHHHYAHSLKVPVEIYRKNQLFPHWPLHHRYHHILNRCVGEQCQVSAGPIALSCDCLYRPAMVVIVVVVVIVAVFVKFFAVVVFGAGRPPNVPLSPCHPSNGENTKA